MFKPSEGFDELRQHMTRTLSLVQSTSTMTSHRFNEVVAVIVALLQLRNRLLRRDALLP